MALNYDTAVEQLAAHSLRKCANVTGCDYADLLHRLSLQIQWAIEEFCQDVELDYEKPTEAHHVAR